VNRLSGFANDNNRDDEKKIDKILAGVCFLISAFAGYFLINYLLF